jgi:hypothetical protein
MAVVDLVREVLPIGTIFNGELFLAALKGCLAPIARKKIVLVIGSATCFDYSLFF